MACILLAEDDDSLRAYLERALAKAGHVVTACGRGDQALTHLRGSPGLYDVLVTDIVMPELDGITLAREAATLTPAPRVLFITGFATVALSAANGGARPETVLSKPFHLRDLVRAIDTVLAPAGAA